MTRANYTLGVTVTIAPLVCNHNVRYSHWIRAFIQERAD
jgi:hypothetical protein